MKNLKDSMSELLKFLGSKNHFNEIDKVFNPYMESRGTLSQKILNNKTINQIIPKFIPFYARQNLINKFLYRKGEKIGMTD